MGRACFQEKNARGKRHIKERTIKQKWDTTWKTGKILSFSVFRKTWKSRFYRESQGCDQNSLAEEVRCVAADPINHPSKHDSQPGDTVSIPLEAPAFYTGLCGLSPGSSATNSNFLPTHPRGHGWQIKFLGPCHHSSSPGFAGFQPWLVQGSSKWISTLKVFVSLALSLKLEEKMLQTWMERDRCVQREDNVWRHTVRQPRTWSRTSASLGIASKHQKLEESRKDTSPATF